MSSSMVCTPPKICFIPKMFKDVTVNYLVDRIGQIQKSRWQRERHVVEYMQDSVKYNINNKHKTTLLPIEMTCKVHPVLL